MLLEGEGKKEKKLAVLTIDNVHSEFVIEDGSTARRDDADKPVEVRVEELRTIVRELVSEELARFLRTEVRD